MGQHTDKIREMVMALSRGDHEAAQSSSSEVMASKMAGITESRRSERDYDYYEIHRSKHGDGFDVKGIKQDGYGPNSVLAGQDLIQFLDSFDSYEEAKAAYPDAEMSGEWTGARNTFDHLPGDDDPDPWGDDRDAANDW